MPINPFFQIILILSPIHNLVCVTYIPSCIFRHLQKAIKNVEEDDRRRAKREADLEVARVRNQQVRDAIHKSPDITIPELQNMFNDMNPKAIEGSFLPYHHLQL